MRPSSAAVRHGEDPTYKATPKWKGVERDERALSCAATPRRPSESRVREIRMHGLKGESGNRSA